MFDMNRANDQYIFYVERFHRFDNELQSNSELLHVTGFLRIIYPILNASVILQRNETRGGNLLLSGTVYLFFYVLFLLDAFVAYQ